MPLTALTSAEISLPGTPDALRVRERIAALADTVDVVGLTDNHAGQPRMSPLAAVALAREQGNSSWRSSSTSAGSTTTACTSLSEIYLQSSTRRYTHHAFSAKHTHK